ncbi:MAG: hypothetical protein DSY90_14490 [Deltaproteobacteria bacterium]|nr:MAG: hypothetical protein DSY90_14490 [Deltaproteobacteria bacterium]
MNYIRTHWNGEFSLRRSFWVHFLVLIIAYYYIGQWIRLFLYAHPEAFVLAVIAHLVVFWLILYPWQVVGLLRACGKHSVTHDHPLWARAVQAIVILSFLGTLIHLLGSIQLLAVYKNKINNQPEDRLQAKYALSLVRNERFIHLRGTIDFGVTSDVEEILRHHSGIEGIILDSPGGIVYEGRGLFMLIKKHGLDTYSFRSCSSACAIAFIGGARRFLGEAARLGFHQYRLDSDRVQPFSDIESEQQKDLSLYKGQMIKDEFLDRIFDTPQSEIWFPAQTDLIAAGVVDRIIPDGELPAAGI